MSKRVISTLAVFLLATIGDSSAVFADTASAEAQQAILVTGASSGIGRNLAETLAKEGYFVYAGARKQADMDALNKIPNIQAVRLDVTKQDEIDAAVATVRAGGKGLYGLVNNAGVVTLGPITEISEDDLTWIFNVNVFGVYRVTKAFAPQIIESTGRIVNISSISGILYGMFWAPYTHDQACARDVYGRTRSGDGALRRRGERDQSGQLQVPDRHKESEMLAKQPYAQPASPYAEAIRRSISSTSPTAACTRNQTKCPPPSCSALFDASPKPNYLVVPSEEEAGWTIRRIIEEMAELNADQEFTYSDEELIEMLKEATAAERKRGARPRKRRTASPAP